MSTTTERLFSYGTLQLPEVQRANFSRLLDGAPDELVGFRLERLEVTDPDVLTLSGERYHLIAVPTGSDEDRAPGVVFALTPDELAATDAYEVEDYTRVEVTLASGLKAWAYVRV